MNKDFWKDMVIPFQNEDDELQFANLVAVSQHFIKAVGLAAQLGEQAEALTEQLANVTITLERKQRDLSEFRKSILAKHYKRISKSAGKDVQEAFIRAMADEDGREQELIDLDAEIEKLTREIEIRTPRVAQYKARLKMLEMTMGWGKQYLDFEKLIIRSSTYGT